MEMGTTYWKTWWQPSRLLVMCRICTTRGAGGLLTRDVLGFRIPLSLTSSTRNVTCLAWRDGRSAHCGIKVRRPLYISTAASAIISEVWYMAPRENSQGILVRQPMYIWGSLKRHEQSRLNVCTVREHRSRGVLRITKRRIVLILTNPRQASTVYQLFTSLSCVTRAFDLSRASKSCRVTHQ